MGMCWDMALTGHRIWDENKNKNAPLSSVHASLFVAYSRFLLVIVEFCLLSLRVYKITSLFETNYLSIFTRDLSTGITRLINNYLSISLVSYTRPVLLRLSKLWWKENRAVTGRNPRPSAGCSKTIYHNIHNSVLSTHSIRNYIKQSLWSARKVNTVIIKAFLVCRDTFSRKIVQYIDFFL